MIPLTKCVFQEQRCTTAIKAPAAEVNSSNAMHLWDLGIAIYQATLPTSLFASSPILYSKSLIIRNSFLYFYSEFISKCGDKPLHAPFPWNPRACAAIPAEIIALELELGLVLDRIGESPTPTRQACTRGSRNKHQLRLGSGGRALSTTPS